MEGLCFFIYREALKIRAVFPGIRIDAGWIRQCIRWDNGTKIAGKFLDCQAAFMVSWFLS